MKSLCITGSVQSTLDRFAESLSKAGATAARPAISDQEISIAAWHRKVLAIHATVLEVEHSSPPPLGRAWEQLASEIFLANHTQPLWYWADTSSIHALDFWLDFDPNTFFLLLHTSPRQALMDSIKRGEDSLEALQTTLDEWYGRTRRILRFHLRNPVRSVLIGNSELLGQTSAYLEALAQRWQLPLDAQNSGPSLQADNHPLTHYLVVDKFLLNHPQALALHDEVQASLFLVGNSESLTMAAGLNGALADYLGVCRQFLSGQTENASPHQPLVATQTQLAETCHTLQSQQIQLEALAREKAELIVAHKALDRGKISLQVIYDALVEEKSILPSTNQKQLESLSTETAAPQTRLDSFAKDHEQQYVQRRQVLEEQESENELLLVQLHHSQEKLEQYLLHSQTIQARLDEQQKRLQRMLERYPDYWDFDTLEANQLESTDNQQTVQWRLTNLYIGGRSIPEIRFKTCLTNGLAGIVIQRTEGTNSPAPLLRWPNAFATAEELPCIPTRGASTSGSNAALSGLSPSDWDTLQRLARQLAGLLAQPTGGRFPKELNTAALSNGLLAFAQTLTNWPTMLRYDSIQLQATLNADGYERLEIGLGNLCLGNRHWPALDYRLASIDHGPHPFGQNPRLEFPNGSARSVLQHWFEEARDNNDPRLELRFAQPSAMDTHVWSMLSPNDQQLIFTLIKTLPLQLQELQQANPAASRPWQDWQALASMLRYTLKDILIVSTTPRRTSAEDAE